MGDLIIKFSASDEEAVLFEGRMAMVVALSEEEATMVKTGLNSGHAYVQMARHGLGELRQRIEARGMVEPEIARMLDMLSEPAAMADELLDRTREIIGRAIFVEAHLDKGRLQ